MSKDIPLCNPEEDNIETFFGKELYGVLFHYNSHRKQWSCFTRQEIVAYFNGYDATETIGNGTSVTEAFIDYKNKKTDLDIINNYEK